MLGANYPGQIYPGQAYPSDEGGGPPAATLTQSAFRFYNDDGVEAAATTAAAENAAHSVAAETPVQLRIQLDASGDPDAGTYQLEYRSRTPVTGLPAAEGDWTNEGIIFSGDPGQWDDNIWGGAIGTVLKVGSTYYMYYGGADGMDINDSPTNRALGVATSSDGESWTRYGSNPIVTYTTTGGVEEEEGASHAVILELSGTWHMWYAASRSTGGSSVDVDIRYRTSTDGLTWTGDALVKQVSGQEFVPACAFYDAGVYHLYYLGNLVGGAGPLNHMYGSSPSTLSSGDEQIATGPYRYGGRSMPEMDSDTLLLPIVDTNSEVLRYFTIEKSAPGTESSQIESYQFSGYEEGSIFLDIDNDRWLLYQRDSTGGAQDGNYLLRTATRISSYTYGDWTIVS